MNPDLTPDQLAAIRKGIREATQRGVSSTQLDGYLKEKFGLTSAQAMKPTGRDADRAMMQGLTLGHADELYGLYKKMTGGDYTTARDQVRTNEAEASAANPWTMGVTSAIGGAAPAAAATLIPGMQPVAGATLANAGRGAIMGGVMGAITGEGNSTASSAGGVARDAAIGGSVGGVLGGAGGAVASKLAGGGLPGGNAGTVATAASTVLPLDPAAATATMARQHALVPGSVVLADASPEMQSFLRVIGANPKVAIPARQDAATRLTAIVKAKEAVGKLYNDFDGVKAPTDPEIVTALMDAQRRGVISKADNILVRGPKRDLDLGELIDLRKVLNKRARGNGQDAYDARQVSNRITEWISKQNDTIQQIDRDFAFLSARQDAANETLQTITKSLAAHGRGEAANVEPASVGGSLPTTVRSTAGTAMQIMKKAVGVDKAARAKAVADLLLTPQQDATAFNRLVQLRDLIVNPPKSIGLAAGSAGLAGVVAPQSAGALVGALQP